MSFLVGVQTHKRSSAWWIRCNCRLSEYVCRVKKVGGNATAVSTVVPSMFGNSERIPSQTIPAYDPALWPRIESVTPICSACLIISAFERLGGRQIPASGCVANNLVKSRRLCLYPAQGGLRCAGVTGPNCNKRWAL